MQKITFFYILLFLTTIVSSQTVVWSSDASESENFNIIDLDDDGKFWGAYSDGAESLGFAKGPVFFSESWDKESGALTPDNFIITPEGSIRVPNTAKSISFKLKVGAADKTDFAEKFAIYVYDEREKIDTAIPIYVETLTAGGENSAKDITAEIPISFVNKPIRIIIRHFDCTNQFQLLIDDFEVSYSTVLAVTDNKLEVTKIYPNPAKDFLKIKTDSNIDKIAIFNNLGQIVLELDKKDIFDNTIDVKTLSKGVYFITVISENNFKSIKFIKE